MDLQKIQIRQDLERMVLNYFLNGKIEKNISERLIGCIHETIGGGELPAFNSDCKLYLFPGACEDTARQVTSKAAAPDPYDIEAPYGTGLPAGVQDFRPLLQRDGLILICWKKYISKEGSFFNVLWAKSSGGKRNTRWSGRVREEEIPYTMPDDAEYRFIYHEECKEVYTVSVAPDHVLHGPISDLPKYIQSLKDFGLTVNFDYNFIFGAEKRNRFLEKNKELIPLKLPPRILNAFNDMEIFTIEGLQNLTVKKLQSIKGVGSTTILETLSILEKQGIILQEEKQSYV
jgi:hypothetical protein